VSPRHAAVVLVGGRQAKPALLVDRAPCRAVRCRLDPDVAGRQRQASDQELTRHDNSVVKLKLIRATYRKIAVLKCFMRRLMVKLGPCVP
jgi:hypothetical protein